MEIRTLKEQVVQHLRGAIISAQIKPGERLNESQLARKLGVSRLPIREALQQLQEQGLVIDIPRRGKFVISLTEEDIQKINSVRLILEAEALRICRVKVNPQGIGSLENLIEKMERSSGAPEIDAAALDLEFHKIIWAQSSNDCLVRVLEGITVPLLAHRALWRINQEILGWAAILANHHRALLDFIEGRVRKSAEEVILDHLNYRYTQPARFSSFGLQSSETGPTETNV